MPRFILLIKADPMAESADMSIPTEVFETMAKFNEEMADAGVLLFADGFRPTSIDGYRVNFSSSGPPVVTSGPFNVSEENHVCGFWVIQTKDAEEALTWAKKVPFPEGELVVRRIGDHNDFGASYTSELREQEDKLRVKLENNRRAAGV
ncbi:dgpfaetke family protein [Purpureocillium lavendulum]|uniref:Dgpfaetke family protein n=1 Tax=Purpureocillium lavendulum TaxID=1247861 RepID=A0AB34FZ78_9HYPO|nr:dgpfaetke family protein [Purpureocillium lavendulum]